MTLTGLFILSLGAFLVAVAGLTSVRQYLRGSLYASRVSGLWGQSDFGWYWAGTSVQSLAQGMQFLVLGWLVLEVTGSSTQLGLVVFLYGIPNVCLMLFGGVIADRVDRKWLLMVTQAAVGGLVLILGGIVPREKAKITQK
jgi:predicted MFS family arabinose efflux permease